MYKALGWTMFSLACLWVCVMCLRYESLSVRCRVDDCCSRLAKIEKRLDDIDEDLRDAFSTIDMTAKFIPNVAFQRPARRWEK